MWNGEVVKFPNFHTQVTADNQVGGHDLLCSLRKQGTLMGVDEQARGAPVALDSSILAVGNEGFPLGSHNVT